MLKVGHITKAQKGANVEDTKELVVRGSTDEAVVGVKLQPISSLVVHQVKLRNALQGAIQKFIDSKQSVTCKSQIAEQVTGFSKLS